MLIHAPQALVAAFEVSRAHRAMLSCQARSFEPVAQPLLVRRKPLGDRFERGPRPWRLELRKRTLDLGSALIPGKLDVRGPVGAAPGGVIGRQRQRPSHQPGGHHHRAGSHPPAPTPRGSRVGPQRGQQLRHGRKALVGISGQRPANGASGSGGEPRPGGDLGGTVDDRGPPVGERALGERTSAKERLVQGHRKRELIGSLIDRSPIDLLGRHIDRSTHDGAGRGQGRGGRRARDDVAPGGDARELGERARQPEVDDPRDPIGPDQHVVGLEVAVHQPGRVRSGQALTGPLIQREDLGGRALAAGDPPTGRRAIDQFHGDEQLALVGPDLVHGDHIRMRQASHRGGLAEQPLRAVGHGAMELECHVAAEPEVARAIDDPHPAGADPLDDLERGADPRAGCEPSRRTPGGRLGEGGERAELVRVGLGLERRGIHRSVAERLLVLTEAHGDPSVASPIRSSWPRIGSTFRGKGDRQ